MACLFICSNMYVIQFSPNITISIIIRCRSLCLLITKLNHGNPQSKEYSDSTRIGFYTSIILIRGIYSILTESTWQQRADNNAMKGEQNTGEVEAKQSTRRENQHSADVRCQKDRNAKRAPVAPPLTAPRSTRIRHQQFQASSRTLSNDRLPKFSTTNERGPTSYFRPPLSQRYPYPAFLFISRLVPITERASRQKRRRRYGI